MSDTYDAATVNYLASKHPKDFETAYILVRHIMEFEGRACFTATDELVKRKPFLFYKMKEDTD